VEIGVDRGEYSQHFFNSWYGHTYFGVDDYARHFDHSLSREGDFHAAVSKYSAHSGRARLILESSVVVAEKIHLYTPPPIDWVYIDADHSYEAVKTDIKIWWEKLSDRGILAGHDYDETHPGVMRAVQEFADEIDGTVYLTHEVLPSWYIYKMGIPGPDWKRA